MKMKIDMKEKLKIGKMKEKEYTFIILENVLEINMMQSLKMMKVMEKVFIIIKIEIGIYYKIKYRNKL